MSRTTILAGIAILTALHTSGWAQGEGNQANENAQLQSRVKNLEQQVQDLTAARGSEDGQTAGTQGGEKKPLWSKLDVQFYGYIKADAAYDNSRADVGNFIRWVTNEGSNRNDDQFSLTANQTRLGFNISGPKGQGMETSGKVEVDFYASGGAENKPKIQMRHGYLQMAWPDSDLALLAGQTWDVIAPLNPSTLNYTVLWWTGNIGYRRPQIRLTKDHMLSGDTSLKFQGAITRTVGRTVLGPGAGTESGEDAGFPTVQGRASMTYAWLPAGRTTVGVSAHYGQEEYDINAAGDSDSFDSWSLNADWLQPINEWMTLKAEAFTGKNLNAYLGGIGQGMRAAGGGYDKEIASKGGWAALGLGPWDQWRFNVGIGIDDVERDDVNDGDRTLNRAVFGNAIYALNKHADVGVELSQWRTDYRGAGDADNVRLQASLMYKF